MYACLVILGSLNDVRGHRLGHGDAHKRLVPTRVQALAGLRVVAVAVNGRHSLALT